MENCSKTIGEKRGGEEHRMQNIGAELCLVGKDNVSSPTDPKERAVLEEQLYWARLERQKFLALSAEADETIWDLAALARRTMQERDEARNQERMILADVLARNARMETMLPGQAAGSRAARPGGVFTGAGANSQALAIPFRFRPLGDAAVQGRHDQTGTGYCVASSGNSGHRTGTGDCVASSSNSGHRSRASSTDAYTVRPPLSIHGPPSSIQEHFDPDMFLVDAAESPQDPVPATAETPPVQRKISHFRRG